MVSFGDVLFLGSVYLGGGVSWECFAFDSSPPIVLRRGRFLCPRPRCGWAGLVNALIQDLKLDQCIETIVKTLAWPRNRSNLNESVHSDNGLLELGTIGLQLFSGVYALLKSLVPPCVFCLRPWSRCTYSLDFQ